MRRWEEYTTDAITAKYQSSVTFSPYKLSPVYTKKYAEKNYTYLNLKSHTTVENTLMDIISHDNTVTKIRLKKTRVVKFWSIQ